MVSGPAPEDVFREVWLTMPADLFLADRTPERPPIAIELRAGAEPVVIETVEGRVRTRRGTVEHPDAVLRGPPQLVLGVLTGKLDLADASGLGLHYEGDPETLRRVLPEAGGEDVYPGRPSASEPDTSARTA
jgi:hypothetical protein